MKQLKIFAAALMLVTIFIFPSPVRAEMPEITANEMYFDIFRGCYVLKGNVYVSVNNHGFKAVVTADEALVSVVNQRCRAAGNVKLTQEDISFSCDLVFLQWQTKTAQVTGAVTFESKNHVAIKSDSAIFNWQTKVVDFYGAVNLKAANVELADGVTLTGEDYQHVQYDVVDNKILAADKNFAAPEIVIPNDV